MRKLLENIDRKIELLNHNKERAQIALDHGIGTDYQVDLIEAKIATFNEVKGLVADRAIEMLEEAGSE